MKYTMSGYAICCHDSSALWAGMVTRLMHTHMHKHALTFLPCPPWFHLGVYTVGLVCYARLNLCDFLVKSIVRFLFMR